MEISEKSRFRLGEASPSQAIRNYIEKQGLKSGDRLPTHDGLCEKLGIGLRRLREGLSVLRQQGLIETKGRGGTVVNSPSVEAFKEPIGWQLAEQGCRFEDLIRARAAMESAAAAEASRVRTARNLLAILDTVERNEAALLASGQDDKTDEEFHLAVVKATNNPALLTFGKLIVGQFHRKVAERKSVEAAIKSRPQHRAIYEAIERRDVELAQKAMFEHVIGQLDDIKTGQKIKKQKDNPNGKASA